MSQPAIINENLDTSSMLVYKTHAFDYALLAVHTYMYMDT